MPEVSIIIPTYNRIDELERAIKSAVSQTYDDKEIIIIDDNVNVHLSDKVYELADKYNVIYKKNKDNLGGALSRNEGIKIARGKYISFLDDDDEILPTKIEKQVSLMKNSSVEKLGVVYCHTKALDENGMVVAYYQNTVKGDFLYENMLNTVAATTQWLCLKEAIESIGGFCNVPSKQDTTFLMDLALNGYRIDYVPEFLSVYHESSINRISGVNERNLSGEILLRQHMREHYKLFTKKQINVIEYNSAWRIYYMQIRLGLFKDSDKSIKDLIKNNQIGIKLLPVLLKHPLRRIIKPKKK